MTTGRMARMRGRVDIMITSIKGIFAFKRVGKNKQIIINILISQAGTLTAEDISLQDDWRRQSLNHPCGASSRAAGEGPQSQLHKVIIIVTGQRLRQHQQLQLALRFPLSAFRIFSSPTPSTHPSPSSHESQCLLRRVHHRSGRDRPCRGAA